ncbi:cytochrome P450 2 sub U member 1 [Branchiostoma belcheri]|nr:cytochrome P450 2 sub U member 1 [Branchiostoma belcheri]
MADYDTSPYCGSEGLRHVQQERQLDAVVGEGLPALSHRSQLPYVNACLLEVMRIRTVVPFALPHATTETDKADMPPVLGGEQLARLKLFLFFSTLLQSFTFNTPEGAPTPACTANGVIVLQKPDRYPAGRVNVLGHLLALGRAPHLKLTAWRRQYGDVFTVRMGMEVLNGYTAVKDALVDTFFHAERNVKCVCLAQQLARLELFLFFSTLLQSFTFKLPEGAPSPNTSLVRV